MPHRAELAKGQRIARSLEGLSTQPQGRGGCTVGLNTGHRQTRRRVGRTWQDRRRAVPTDVSSRPDNAATHSATLPTTTATRPGSVTYRGADVSQQRRVRRAAATVLRRSRAWRRRRLAHRVGRDCDAVETCDFGFDGVQHGLQAGACRVVGRVLVAPANATRTCVRDIGPKRVAQDGLAHSCRMSFSYL